MGDHLEQRAQDAAVIDNAVEGTLEQRRVAARQRQQQRRRHILHVSALAAVDGELGEVEVVVHLLEEGKQAMMQRNPGLNPKFGDEWVRRMKERVKPDDFVEITAKVYATYYTSDELEQMTQAQLALKNSRIYSVSPELNQKIKANASHIQTDINTNISRLGSSMSIEVGQEIEKEHPEWAKPLPPGPAAGMAGAGGYSRAACSGGLGY